MVKLYRSLSSPKIRFLDDILFELEKEPVEQNEDYIAPKVCFEDSKPTKIFGSFRIPKPFIPEGKERKYFRIAIFYLEREKLITTLRINPYTPTYIINYEGIVLVKSGGLCRKLFLEKLSGILQRLAWLIVFVTFLVNTLIQLGYIRTSTESGKKTTPKSLVNKNTIEAHNQAQKSNSEKTVDMPLQKDSIE